MRQAIQRMGLVIAVVLAFQEWGLPAQGAPLPIPAGLKKAGAVQQIDVRIEPSVAKRGQTVTWKLTVDLAPGWHTYPFRQTDPQVAGQVTKILFSEPKTGEIAEMVPVGRFKEPKPLSKAIPALGIQNQLYYEGQVIWQHPLVVNPKAQPGKKTIKAQVTSQICDANTCQRWVMPLEASLTISDAPAVPVDPQYQAAVTAAAKPAPAPPPVGGNHNAARPTANPEQVLTQNPAEQGAGDATLSEDHQASMERVFAQLEPQQVPNTGLLAFILTGVFWGAVSLVTPCVFPMIPITVSFFLKQSEKEHHRPITMALVYCSTIVGVLTVAAVALLSFFRWLSINPVMNFALGALFIFFALSLFGMYEIELPSGLARFTSAREGKGGLVGTMFMALTFTIVSFACVAPFLGGFGGTSATSSLTWTEKVLGGLAFSATFAAPFFILALFPSLLKKLPKSGSWLNSVKVVMGFLELAAALKFLRMGELVLVARPSFFTYDLVLGIWIALSLLCGLYLLNLYRLPHDTPIENLSVPRLMGSLVFLGLSFYLLPALFASSDGEKQRPRGAIYAWVDAFLLPEPQEAKDGLAWSGNLEKAIEEARTYRGRTGQKKLVFVDFTGQTCTNCRLNEREVFSKPDIQKLFQPYELVQLYTDVVPNDLYPSALRAQLGDSEARRKADAAANLWFQKAAFDTEQLPLYAILDPLPNGKIGVAAVYAEGKINNEQAFVQFLKKPLEASNQLLRAEVRGH